MKQIETTYSSGKLAVKSIQVPLYQLIEYLEKFTPFVKQVF